MNKFLLIVPLLLIGGCSSLEDKNPQIEYEKLASLVCDGNYQVYSNGLVTNEKLTAFNESPIRFEEMHEVAQNNYFNLKSCLNTATAYFKTNDIKAKDYTDSQILVIRKEFISNMTDIKNEIILESVPTPKAETIGEI